MTTRTFTTEHKNILIRLINEGMQTTHEIETLKQILNDTVKAIAEDLQVKPAVLKKAINLAHRSAFGQQKQDHEMLETIMETAGKTL